KTLVGCFVLGAVAALSFAAGRQTKEEAAKPKSTLVGIYMESVQRQIDIRELRKRYPGEAAQKIDPAALRADAIVGWYDRGNNYHEQKMQNNLKSFGAIQILPETLRGTALKGMSATPKSVQEEKH